MTRSIPFDEDFSGLIHNEREIFCGKPVWPPLRWSGTPSCQGFGIHSEWSTGAGRQGDDKCTKNHLLVSISKSTECNIAAVLPSCAISNHVQLFFPEYWNLHLKYYFFARRWLFLSASASESMHRVKGEGAVWLLLLLGSCSFEEHFHCHIAICWPAFSRFFRLSVVFLLPNDH